MTGVQTCALPICFPVTITAEIEKVKKAAQEYNPTEKIKQELDLRKQIEGKSSDELIQESKEENKLSDEYQGPVSR